MKTFFNILQTVIGIKNKSYPDDPFILSENNIYFGEKGHIKSLINSIHFKQNEYKNKNKNQYSKNAFAKFTCLNSILENTFYKNELKELIFDTFSKSQKYYFAFTRLLHLYKIKKHPYIVTNDLMMNKLEPKHEQTFILLENKSNYLFNINEIITIIENAICNSPDFISEPLSPLNPYNKQEFTSATLYNIYFQMKKLGRLIPLLFHCFFLENFNKQSFSEQYEPIIREQAINKYIFNSPHTILYPHVISLIKTNYYTKQLCIHKDFPKDLLVNIFRPFLFYDFISKYYIVNTTKYHNTKDILQIKLKKFYQANKAFGRRFIKIIKLNNKIIKREYSFNTKHVSFYDIHVTLFNNNEHIYVNTNSTRIIRSINNRFNINQYYDDNDDIANYSLLYDDDETSSQTEEGNDSIS